MTFGSLQQALPEWAMDLFIEAASLEMHNNQGVTQAIRLIEPLFSE